MSALEPSTPEARDMDRVDRERREDAELFEAKGFHVIRQELLAGVAAVENVPIPVVEALIRRAERRGREVEIEGEGDPAAIADDVKVMRAVLNFRNELVAVAQAREARAKITGKLRDRKPKRRRA